MSNPADRVPGTPPTNTPIVPTSLPSTAAASPLDPIYGLIDAHRIARAAHLASLDEQNRLERIGDPDAELVSEGPGHAEWDSLDALIETPAVTFAGLVAWASYLRQLEEWILADKDCATALIATIDKALQRLAVQS